jgi:uncharacterized protein (TIGR03435 family)
LRTLFVILLFVAIGTAQPAFDVASIKPNTSGDRSSFKRTERNSLILQNWPLRRIILWAYDLKDYALTGPGWLASINFDINAKSDGPVAETQLRQMLKALLIERFRLKAHTAFQDKPAYALLTMKGGIKAKPINDGSTITNDCDLSRFPQTTKLSCRHCSLDCLAEVLSGQLDSIVVNRSGIQATYAFTLEWSPDSSTGVAAASIFSALNEQLGLRLERRHAPISILMVESIAKTPAEN